MPQKYDSVINCEQVLKLDILKKILIKGVQLPFWLANFKREFL